MFYCTAELNHCSDKGLLQCDYCKWEEKRTSKMTTLAEFWDMLAAKDWYYEMSDDHSVWTRGVAYDQKLAAIRKESPEHEKLASEFTAHYYSGKPWGTVQSPLPERPK